MIMHDVLPLAKTGKFLQRDVQKTSFNTVTTVRQKGRQWVTQDAEWGEIYSKNKFTVDKMKRAWNK